MTRFLLNDREAQTDEPPGRLLLDYLRREAGRVDVKEGCREGDCGACTVLVGELEGGEVGYRPMTSCLMPLGEVEGRHVVTVEGLNLDELTPVQEAIVELGATQCGFCTPGIVVSLTGLLLDGDAAVDEEGIFRALSGHLCRCTGYRSLKACGDVLREALGEPSGVDGLIAGKALPAYFGDVAERLRVMAEVLRDTVGDEGQGAPARGAVAPCSETLGPDTGGASAGQGDVEGGSCSETLGPDTGGAAQSDGVPVFVAGGTDLYVQQGERLPTRPVAVLNHDDVVRCYPEMRGIERRNGHLRVGALSTFEEIGADPEVRRWVPRIGEYMELVASWQIRTRATLGGNLINASPIGDLTALVLALRGELVLADGDARRTVPIATFYRGYKEMDLRPVEVLVEVLLPVPEDATRVHFEKVSKRRCLDIASVNCALTVRADGAKVADAELAVGGVAPVPLLLRRTAERLRGAPLDAATITDALSVAQGEIAPIDDVRGSADYKRLLTRQLLVAGFVEMFPERLAVEELLAPS